jgi:DNA-binding IclR family transcriptional regulator
MAMDFTRTADANDPPPLHALPTQQRRILEVVAGFENLINEGCSISMISRVLRIGRSTARDHVEALHRKGWLKSSGSPIRLRRRLD